MGGLAARKKGKKGEREIAHLLSSFFYPDGSGKLVRTPQSGAWGGTAVMSGDLVPICNEKIDDRLPFFWEVKTVKRDAIPAFGLLSGEAGPLLTWLTKAAKTAKSDLIPVVVWKVDFSTPQFFLWLSDYLRLQPGEASFEPLVMTFGRNWVNIPWSSFAEWFPKGRFI